MYGKAYKYREIVTETISSVQRNNIHILVKFNFDHEKPSYPAVNIALAL